MDNLNARIGFVAVCSIMFSLLLGILSGMLFLSVFSAGFGHPFMWAFFILLDVICMSISFTFFRIFLIDKEFDHSHPVGDDVGEIMVMCVPPPPSGNAQVEEDSDGCLSGAT